jgi:hypothetical protein
MDFFDRGLPLPEYEVQNIRRTGPTTAYYRRFWLADAINPETPPAETTFYLTERSTLPRLRVGRLDLPESDPSRA